MKKKDLFGDDVEAQDNNDFAAMFEQSLQSADRRLKVGDKLKGEILSMQKEEAFISTGTPNDAVILLKDLLDKDGKNPFKTGDIIEVVVTKVRDDEVRVTRKGSTTASADLESLEDAFDMELPVEGRVIEAVKGGFRVQVQGKMAFCPVSQMDSRFVSDSSEYIGKKFEFIVTQFESGGRNIVVSRRKLLDLQKVENEGSFLRERKAGDVLQGKISRLEKFGAFVQLTDGVEGLVHISELAWGRVKDPSEVVQVGQDVQVKVLRLEEEGDRLKISLSLKQGGGESDPWLSMQEKFPVGTIVEGVVDKREGFGLFVTLAPGVTGLLPKSKWRDTLEASTYEGKKKGERIKVAIDEVRLDDRRISLGLPSEAEDQSWRAHSGGGKSGGLGTFADLLKRK